MKKLFLILIVVALYQNWHKVENFFHPKAAVTAEQADVVLYATSWCGYCEKARKVLDDEGVAYVEYDIEKSDEGRRQHAALKGRGVPVLDIGGTVIHGYNERAIRDLVKQH